MRRWDSRLLSKVGDRRVYFVHSYRATPSPENNDWVLATTSYGSNFVSAIQKGEINATQFHPEKSGTAGLDIIESFLEPPEDPRPPHTNGDLLAVAIMLCISVDIAWHRRHVHGLLAFHACRYKISVSAPYACVSVLMSCRSACHPCTCKLLI